MTHAPARRWSRGTRVFIGLEPNVVSPPVGADGSTGVFTVDRGTNVNRKLNADNPVAQPGVRNGGQQARAEVDRNLALLGTQISDASERLTDPAAKPDPNFVNNASHRDHIRFPDPNTGACPAGTRAVPRLRISIAYDIPTDIRQKGQYQLDAFDEENHDPASDHDEFLNVNSAETMAAIADCVNAGRRRT